MGRVSTSIDEIKQIKTFAKRGMRYAEIARKISRSPAFVSTVVRGEHKLSSAADAVADVEATTTPTQKTTDVRLRPIALVVSDTGMNAAEKLSLIKSLS